MLVGAGRRFRRCVLNDCIYVAVGCVFAFYDLDLTLSAVCEIFDWFALFVEGEAYRPDKVWFVVFGSMLWV